MKRLVQAELLDALPPEDPRAIRSRRDLHRINWWMRNHVIMARALEKNLPAAPKAIIELGAGDGNFLLRVAQRVGPRWPAVQATLLDLQENVSPQTLAAFAESGWHAQPVVADVFDWSPASAEPVVIANLFLHHFEDGSLSALLRKISQNTSRFVAVEPHRFTRPSLIGQALRLIGCNAVTRHDAAASICAGFDGEELSALWPDKDNWRLTECRAGLFSHLFIACRRE
ncbi:MAG: class I SAM-dependent methyltransferase [Verrucomicrobiota bacterium]